MADQPDSQDVLAALEDLKVRARELIGPRWCPEEWGPLRGPWRGIVREQCPVVLDTLGKWAERYAPPEYHPLDPLDSELGERLESRDIKGVAALLREQVQRSAVAFDPTGMPEAHMAATACAMGFMRDFADAIDFALEPEGFSSPRACNIRVPPALWKVAERPLSVDPTTFAVTVHIPILAVLLDCHQYPLPREFIGDQCSFALARDMSTRRYPRNFSVAVARAALAGGVTDAEGERPALVVLAWAAANGLVESWWSAIQAKIERKRKASPAFHRLGAGR